MIYTFVYKDSVKLISSRNHPQRFPKSIIESARDRLLGIYMINVAHTNYYTAIEIYKSKAAARPIAALPIPFFKAALAPFEVAEVPEVPVVADVADVALVAVDSHLPVARPSTIDCAAAFFEDNHDKYEETSVVCICKVVCLVYVSSGPTMMSRLVTVVTWP